MYLASHDIKEVGITIRGFYLTLWFQRLDWERRISFWTTGISMVLVLSAGVAVPVFVPSGDLWWLPWTFLVFVMSLLWLINHLIHLSGLGIFDPDKIRHQEMEVLESEMTNEDWQTFSQIARALREKDFASARWIMESALESPVLSGLAFIQEVHIGLWEIPAEQKESC